VTANVAAMRFVSTHYRLLVIATTEANRASYRSESAAEEASDIAAGAESRAIEFGAQTQLVLRTPKDHPDVIHVRVAKNRRMVRGEFWLEIGRTHHSLRPYPDPSECPEQRAEAAEAEKRQNRAAVDRDAVALAAVLRGHHLGIGERALRGELRKAGHRWGIERLEAAKRLLEDGRDGLRLANRGDRKGAKWVLEATQGGRDE